MQIVTRNGLGHRAQLQVVEVTRWKFAPDPDFRRRPLLVECPQRREPPLQKAIVSGLVFARRGLHFPYCPYGTYGPYGL